MARKKVVQTELAGEEYELLRKAVEKEGLTIKRGLREAALRWISTQIPVADDPLFKVKPLKTGVKTDSSRLDEDLYGE